MNFTNDSVVIILIIIIAFVFIFNFDVYVITKNEPICKPIYVTKKVINNEMKQITPLEKNINQEFSHFKETFNNISCNLNTPDNSLTNFTIYGINSTFKKSVIDSVINVLSNIPTDMNNEQIKEIIEYFAIIYETSLNIHDFYNNISNSTKINKDPYNSKYARLVLYLINKFDNDYSCLDDTASNTNNYSKELSTSSSNQQLPTSSSYQQLPISSSNQQLPTSSNQQLPTSSSNQQLPISSSNQHSPTSIYSNKSPQPSSINESIIPKTSSQQFPPNMINQARMMQQANIMNLPSMQSQNSNMYNQGLSTTSNNKETENINNINNKLLFSQSEGKKKCKITKPNNNNLNNNLNNNSKTENFNNIDTYNNAFMQYYASF